MKRVFLIVGLVSLLLVGAGAYVLWNQYDSFLKKPLQATDGEIVFEIKSGSNIRKVARQLLSDGILPAGVKPVSSDLLFVAHARITRKATKIKAGEYSLPADILPDQLLDLFVSGKTLQYQIGFVEGRSFREIIKIVKEHPHLKQTLSSEDHADLMTKLGAPADTKPEGWFFPDTYNFPRNTSDFDVLKRSYETMKAYLQTAWDKRVENPYLKSPYEALILASIVEKETGVPEERPLIAQVFLNRLEKGMLLQTDPTVIYGMGDRYKGNIRKKDLRTDTPFNTYTRKGLPPTPIATPGKAAIDAVFNPQESDMLYFVATGKGDGKHYFSRTYKEHRRAVIKYQLNGKQSRYQGDK